MQKYLTLLIVLLIFNYGFSQIIDRKSLQATRATALPRIDGKLDDIAWQNLPIAKDFVMVEPGSGDKEPDNQKTEVKVIYDDESIYFAVYLFDNHPETIMKQFSDRDNFAQSDVFGVTINPLKDGQNDTEFFVTASGTQLDAKISAANGEDFSWSAVWYSAVSFDDKGWYLEMKIPFSALRFSDDQDQTWHINFYRSIQSSRKEYTWNFINKTIGNLYQYSGILTNLKDIKTPIRLNFLPISTTNITKYEGKTLMKTQLGLDVKYGLNDNFTLDATINPDFSQAGFDNLVLNLGPFETQFEEQRQFFLEGADLLNKGNLFFSRRIGKTPINYGDAENNLNSNESVLSNPSIAKLIGAAKVSGRTKNGLGIAVLDAITDKTEAIIKNNDNQNIRKVLTEPLANYNVLVVDQEFHKNSSVSFVNTNVSRPNGFRSANTTALLLDLSDKENANKYGGFFKMSQIKGSDNHKTFGYASGLSYYKTKGNIRFGLYQSLANENFDINDLGYQQNNNYNNFSGNLSYQTFKPTKHFNSFHINMNVGINRRFKPSVFISSFANVNVFATTLNQFSFGGNFKTNIGKRKDFYEPRTDNYYYIDNPSMNFGGFISSDYRKKLAIDFNTGFYDKHLDAENGYWFGLRPIYRASDKLYIRYSLDYQVTFSEKGYVTTLDDNSIIFGIRDIKSVVNSISGKYSLSDLASITLAFRYNWTPVTYQNQYFKLLESGLLTPSNYSENNNVNFNSWNFDLRYIWQFTRGSELVILYRNAIFNQDDQSHLTFSKNLNNLFQQPLQQNLSVRLVYYLDYNKLKTW